MIARTTYATSTLKQDTTTITVSTNPPGVTLPNSIGPGKVSTVTFSVIVATIPTINPIQNYSYSNYTYTLYGITNSSSTVSNTVITQINLAKLSGITKYVDKTYATCQDTISYIIAIPNTGNVTAQNVLFKGTIPNGTELVANSVFVDGIQQIGANLGTGVTIPSIGPGATTTVTFQVRIQC